MKVIAVLAQKGGVGKTTISTSLAVAAQQDGKAVAVLDLDPQASACFWSDTRADKEITTVPLPASRLKAVISAARDQGTDLVIIDGAAVAKDIIYTASELADLVLIPTRCAAGDFRSMVETLTVVKAIGAQCFVVLNAVPAQGPETTNAIEAVASIGATLCPVTLGSRKAFSRSQDGGLTALEAEPYSKAAAEVKGLYNYTNKLLNKCLEVAA